MADRIRLPIIAETARWGRFGFEGLRYTPDAWQGAIDWMKSTFAPSGADGRTETVLDQLRRAGIYPAIDAPEYTIDGRPQHGGHAAGGQTLGMVAADGIIYYTLDGSDPRLPGGELNPQARIYVGDAIVMDRSRVVKARARTDTEWSALSEAEFLIDVTAADASNLRISEINYHPADPTAAELAAGFDDGDDFEFIELVNISTKTLDLSNVRLERLPVNGGDQGVEFEFAGGDVTLLEPGQHLLVVENLTAFTTRYGTDLPVAGQWSGGLSNQQEQLTLSAGATPIQQFTYDDGWHETTDGAGRTLEVVDPMQDVALWSQASGWRASAAIGGSPGRDGSQVDVVGDANRDGVFNSADLVGIFQAGEYEDGVPKNSTWEEGDWDGDGDFTSGDLVLAFQAGRYFNAATSAETVDLNAIAAAVLRMREEGGPSSSRVNRKDLAEMSDDTKRAEPLLAARELVFQSWP